MANFTAGTSFSDGVTNDVTAAKLNALVADAVPTSNLALTSTNGTISNLTSSTANITLGTIPTLTAGTTTGTAGIFTSGTIATLNSTTPTFLGAITASTNTINVGSGQIYKDASGNVGIGVTSPSQTLHVWKDGGNNFGGIRSQNNNLGTGIAGIEFSSDTTYSKAAIGLVRENINGVGSIAFYNASSTGASNWSTSDERMRIDSDGNVAIGLTSPVARLSLGFSGSSVAGSSYVNTDSGSSTQNYILFYRNTSTLVGSIQCTNTATSYNTSSDYRLKTNLEPISNGINRIKQLPVYRFNWIANESGNKVDGFVAHEAKSIVPECVVGEKDAVDEEGNPIYQGIDQSKIVPLLTAALKESIAKIETLEAKVTALEAA